MKIMTLTNERYQGSPAEIVRGMEKASRSRTRSTKAFMRQFAHRCAVLRPGTRIRHSDSVYFLVDASTYGFIKLLPDHDKNSPDKKGVVEEVPETAPASPG